MTPVSVLHEQANGVHVVAFVLNDERQADPDTVRQFFAEEFLPSTAESTQVLIDLTGVRTIDSASLGPLVQKLRDARNKGGDVALCGVKAAAVREVLSLTRFDQIFPMFDTRDQALTTFS